MCKNMDNLNIGGVPLKSHAVLAPMAGVSDRAYRELCVRFGAAYCVSEMVSSKALSFNSKERRTDGNFRLGASLRNSDFR